MLELISEHACFGGVQQFYSHPSRESGLPMWFSVDDAAKTINQIVTKVVGYMNDITSASQEQSEGIEQVNQAITQMDEVTQQNSALVEQASAASENVQSQASILTQLVNSFILVSSGQAMARGSGHVPFGAQLKTNAWPDLGCTDEGRTCSGCTQQCKASEDVIGSCIKMATYQVKIVRSTM